MKLPPGQHLIEGFPRFGTHLSRPAPAIPAKPTITIRGAGLEPFDVQLSALAAFPRRGLTADFHCVAGWSATNLDWEGVSFDTFYRSSIQPALPPETTVTHFVCCGLDGYRSVVSIDDVLADDVLIADALGGRPLDSDHGAPVRLVSPSQYGYISTKHLCCVEVHTSEPKDTGSMPLRLLKRHPRARVWEEERHRYLPAWSVRHLYRATIAPIAHLSARGGSNARKQA